MVDIILQTISKIEEHQLDNVSELDNMTIHGLFFQRSSIIKFQPGLLV